MGWEPGLPLAWASTTIMLLGENFYELFFTLGMKKECCGLFFLCYCLGMEKTNCPIELAETYFAQVERNMREKFDDCGVGIAHAAMVGHLKVQMMTLMMLVPESKQFFINKLETATTK